MIDEPSALLQRLRGIPGYEWDEDVKPWHSSFDTWHFYGLQTKVASPAATESPQLPRVNSLGDRSTSLSSRPVSNKNSPTVLSSESLDNSLPQPRRVLARVSTHILRTERDFQLGQKVVSHSDPYGEHFLRPLELVRLPARPSNESAIAGIFEVPGFNCISHMVGAEHNQLGLMPFLDFAIGAAECLEILHIENRIVHGEIRRDVFHCSEDGRVRMLNFGGGARAFENGLTTAGWWSLIKTVGIEQKLQGIAPEQTGRLPAEPDSRTDLYSLGILFWSILVGEVPFEGNDPLAIMQAVLSRRIPPVSSKRMDVPYVVSNIIAKLTAKNIEERYKSASGLKHDLMEIRKHLSEGDLEGLKQFKICERDVSSFFRLPTHLIGRKEEQAAILKVVESVANKHTLPESKNQGWSLGSSTSGSDIYIDFVPIDDFSSDTGSSRGSATHGVGELAPSPDSASTAQIGDPIAQTDSAKSVDLAPSAAGGASRGSDFADSRRTPDGASLSNNTTNSEGSRLARKSLKGRRKGRCSLIAITGAGGLGKSTLITHSVQNVVRSRGYFTSTKFDQARKMLPFDTILRLLSSLFRQIFSESDVTTDFHQQLRAFVKPIWSLLHGYLDLPAWLLDAGARQQNASASPSSMRALLSSSSGGADSRIPTASIPHLNQAENAGNIAADWLRSGGSTKTSRFTNIFLSVLRMLATHKFICLVVEDLHWADSESLNLLGHIASSQLPLLLIATCRKEEQLSKQARSLLRSATHIELKPFDEEEITEFVAATMHAHDLNYLVPLVAVIQEKTAGNPFFVREILESCYRERCIFYSWRHSAWEFDMDRIFATFESQVYGSQIGSDFIAKRLDDLPYVARCLLGWASIIGTSFGFEFIKTLMTGANAWPGAQARLPIVLQEDQAVTGLQAALSAFWITQAEQEDKFRWSHDRYMSAAVSSLLAGFDKLEMEYCIAKTMVLQRQVSPNSKVLYMISQHICASVDLLRDREPMRASFRQILFRAAEVAEESGARTPVLHYLKHSVLLLQEDPWDESKPDVNYEESLIIFTHLAENYWYLGHLDEALAIVELVFKNVKSVADATPCWIIKSRIASAQGNVIDALDLLRTCVGKMGVHLPDPTWEQCDEEFYQVKDLIAAYKGNLLKRSMDYDLEIVGPVLVEMISAAFWSDSLMFYQISMTMIRLHIERGDYPQSGLGYLHYASVAVGRFDMTEYGCHIADISKQLLEVHRYNSYTFGRGTTLHALFFGHLQTPLGDQIPILLDASASSIAAGDRILSLLNVGVTAAFRLWSSHDLASIDRFCDEAPSEFNWRDDLRGGVFVTSVQQYLRAMQGKTAYEVADTIMNDDKHDAERYTSWLKSKAKQPDRPLTIYWSYKLVLLFRYGHLEEAMILGEKLLSLSTSFFCARYHYANLFYLSLAYLGRLLEGSITDREKTLVLVGKYTDKIKTAAVVNDINYKSWLLLLGAQNAEVQGQYGTAVQLYEEALDHCTVNDFVMDEGLVLEMYGQSLLRRGARRPARRILAECLITYRSIGATGKADHISRIYENIFRAGLGGGYVENSTQTDIIATANTSFNLEQNEDNATQNLGEESTADRTQAWIAPSMHRSESMIETVKSGGKDIQHQLLGVAGGLDMIDLASILESSHVLSSELQVDKLLSKMTEIILEASGAELAAIVRKGEESPWAVASFASIADGVTAYTEGPSLDAVDNQLHKQMIMLVTRSAEEIFVRNHLEDERFSSVNTSEGRAVIVLPVFHGSNKILGAILVDGPVNSFTERQVSLLRLLVSQISISLANALFLKQIEKVSEENRAMVELQKRSLAAARAAEAKAKAAETIAIRNMKLKEEATQAQQLFFANISHELRTPLNGVIGMSELLKETNLNLKQIGYTDSIRVCADLLLSVINDLLDYTKLQAGKMSLNLLPINLWETIREVVRALSFQNKAKGLQTLEQLDIRENMLVFGDSVRITQILMNLIGNSYKFTSEGTVTVRAVVKEEDAGTIEIVFSVIDTGIGIESDKQGALFVPFSQIEQTSSRKFGGTGLGLSICRALLEVMNGLIWLESEPGVGTNVSFAIKFRKLSAEDSNFVQTRGIEAFERRMSANVAKQANGKKSPSGTIDLSNIPRDELRICIAEDNFINQKIAISFVQKIGFKCEAYPDGQEAITALEKASMDGNPYHLVLMDVQMPRLDGYDATRAIRKHKDPNIRNILVIAMTASAIQGDREKCLDAGMNDYLMKPVRANTLKNLLESYLSQPAKPMPDLQEQANQLAKEVIAEAMSTVNSPIDEYPPPHQSMAFPERPGAPDGGR